MFENVSDFFKFIAENEAIKAQDKQRSLLSHRFRVITYNDSTIYCSMN